jgi:hypothetical protein
MRTRRREDWARAGVMLTALATVALAVAVVVLAVRGQVGR